MTLALTEKAHYEALKHLYKKAYYGIGGHFLAVLIVVYLFIDLTTFYIIFLGLISHLSILGFRAYTVKKFYENSHLINSTDAINKWVSFYRVGVFFTGLAWGLCVILFHEGLPAEYEFFLLTVIAGLGGAGIITIGVFFSVYIAFIAPMMGITFFWILFQHGDIYTATTILFVLMLIYYLVAARQYSNNFNDLLLEKENVLSTQHKIIQRLSKAAEFRDNETGMHIKRMSHYVFLLAKAYGFSMKESYNLSYASAMHDVGKIGISDLILLKPDKLDAQEFEIMKSHTQIGKDILNDEESELLMLAEKIAYTHHEKYDGSGYPQGLKGDAIPIEGRITAVCDVFDALVSSRPYKKAWSNEEAIQYIKEQSGKHFDPHLVELFMSILPNVLEFQQTHQD